MRAMDVFRPKAAVTGALTLAAIGAGVLGLYAGTVGLAPAKPQGGKGTVVVHGPDLLTVDHDRAVPDAFQVLHDRLCRDVPDGKGGTWDPTYKQVARAWASGSPGRAAYARTASEFRDKGGHLVRVETVQEGDRPAWVTVEYDGSGGPLAITSVLLAEMRAAGVEVKN